MLNANTFELAVVALVGTLMPTAAPAGTAAGPAPQAGNADV